MSAGTIIVLNEATYRMTKIDERISANNSDQVKQHNCRKEVLGLKRHGQEQYPELGVGVLHAESTQDTKQSTTGSTTPDEDFWDDAPILCEYRREVLRISGQYTGSKEEGTNMRRVAFKQVRVSYGKHEVVSSPHVDCQVHRSRVHKHRREVRVVDIASRDVPQQVPVSRHKEAAEMDRTVRSNYVPCSF